MNRGVAPSAPGDGCSPTRRRRRPVLGNMQASCSTFAVSWSELHAALFLSQVRPGTPSCGLISGMECSICHGLQDFPQACVEQLVISPPRSCSTTSRSHARGAVCGPDPSSVRTRGFDGAHLFQPPRAYNFDVIFVRGFELHRCSFCNRIVD